MKVECPFGCRSRAGRLWIIVIFGALSCLLPQASAALARPRDRNLVLAGMGVGVPTYALGVAMHEGSHALAGKLLGARILDYSLIPGFHPRTGVFYFGYVTVFGLKNDRQRVLFLGAPKFTDSVILGGFAALRATGALPQNAYAKTALLVLATGFWVDFSKDIFSFSQHNDTMKIYKILGLDSELKRLPARFLHAALSVAMGYAIYRGTRELLHREVASKRGALTSTASESALLWPLWKMPF